MDPCARPLPYPGGHAGTGARLQLVPGDVGEVQVAVRLDVERLPEQLCKVEDPLVDLVRLRLLRARRRCRLRCRLRCLPPPDTGQLGSRTVLQR